MGTEPVKDWQAVASKLQSHRDATIAALTPPLPTLPSDLPSNVTGIPKQILYESELYITELPVEELIPKLANGELNAVDVTKAYLRRAGLAGLLTNCITELLPERALARAKELDDYYATHGKPIGPLHGVPISVKEHIGMKDLTLNAGFVAWASKIAPSDAHILQILSRAGAVFYARTTEPQSLMHLETSSNIYGTTVNPYNRSLSSGGSSGGEGALIGLHGSCLGIGSDIGGSVRSPAANNGIFGYKPSSHRLPTSGWLGTMGGQEQVVAVVGPLSTSFEGLRVFVKSVVGGRPWVEEPVLVPLEWREKRADGRALGREVQEGKRGKLRVGVLWDDGVVKPHPPVTRALKEVVGKLKEQSSIFDVVDFQPYKHDEAWDILAPLYFCDGGKEELDAMAASGEPILPMTKHILLDNPHVREHTISSLWAATQAREAYRTAYAAHWNSSAIDVLLCPVGPWAVPKLETAKYWGYTAQWNLLDYPCLVFPVTNVDIEKDEVGEGERGYVPRNEKDKYNWERWMEQGAEGYRDAPVALQLVGRRWHDEEVFAGLDLILKEAGLPLKV